MIHEQGPDKKNLKNNSFLGGDSAQEGEVAHGRRGGSWEARWLMGGEVAHLRRGGSWQVTWLMGGDVAHGKRGG